MFYLFSRTTLIFILTFITVITVVPILAFLFIFKIPLQYAANNPTPVGPNGNWNMVFDDEFNDAPGMSGPNNGLAASKWNSGWYSGPTSPGVGNTKATTPPINSGTAAFFGPKSLIFPGDDSLHLRMQQGVDNGGSYQGLTVESGMISTAGLLAFNPANDSVPSSLTPYTVNGTSVLEIRARMPGPNADAGDYWPALWMTNAGNYQGTNPNGNAWPGGENYLEELDLIEFYHGSTLGSQGIFSLDGQNGTIYGGVSGAPPNLQNTDLSAAYHTYTYEFTPTTIQVWVDGKAVNGVNPTVAEVEAEWAYPEYLMLTFQANTNPIYPSTATGQPNDMMIDYVRVWQQASGPPPPTGNITNLNFGITNTYPWTQFSCGDVRMDNGITDNLPGSQSLIVQNATCNSNALAFTGDTDPNLGQGAVSSSNQLVGGSSYPEVFPNTSSLSTSYPALLAKAQTSNIPTTDLSTVCTLTNCTLPNNGNGNCGNGNGNGNGNGDSTCFPHGIYLATGPNNTPTNVTLNGYTFNNNSNYIILINGNLTINGPIAVPNGSTVLFATTGNITVAPGVGTTVNSTTSSLDGWYVAGQNFIVNSQGNCNDLRLNIAGSVVANALGAGGTFQNNRDLCGGDTTNPTVSVTQRLDMILNAPQFIEHQQTLSQELAP